MLPVNLGATVCLQVTKEASAQDWQTSEVQQLVLILAYLHYQQADGNRVQEEEVMRVMRYALHCTGNEFQGQSTTFLQLGMQARNY